MQVIFDSCTIKYLLKDSDQVYFLKGLILPFQKTELTEAQLKLFKKYGGRVLKSRSTQTGDCNFFKVSPKKYAVYSYDKKLNRQLKSKGYLVINSKVLFKKVISLL